jgi:hypothetical protein
MGGVYQSGLHSNAAPHHTLEESLIRLLVFMVFSFAIIKPMSAAETLRTPPIEKATVARIVTLSPNLAN